MSPPRRPKTGMNFRNYFKAEAMRALANYSKRTSPSSGNHRSPKTAASLMRLRGRARKAVTTARQYNTMKLQRNEARISRMINAIANYEARRRHKLVRQPSGSYSLARRN